MNYRTKHLFLVVLLFVLVPASYYIDTALAYDFIGSSDRAEVAQCARNITEGNGPVVDCVWLLHGKNDVPITHGIRYFSLYVSYWVALFFYLFGSVTFSALLAGSVAKSLMAVSAFFFVRKFNSNSWAAIACAFAILFGRTWTKHQGLLSDIYLASVVMIFCFMLTHWYNTAHLRYSIACGLLAGIATGVKPSGLLLIVIPFMLYPIIIWFLKKKNQFITRNLLAFCAAVCVTVSPLAIHNYREAETLWWPDATRVASAGTTSEGWVRGFSDPSLKPHTLSVQEKFKRVMGNYRDFIIGFFKGQVIQIFWIPFVGFSLVLALRQLKDDSEMQKIFGLIACTLFATIIPLHYLIHFEPRYSLYAVTPGIVLCFCNLWTRFRTGLIVALCVIVVVSPLTICYRVWNDWTPSTAVERMMVFKELEKHISPDEVVLIRNPWEFTFHTRIKSVMMPIADNPNVVRSVAQQYGADKIIIWPKCSHLYRELADGKSTDWATCIVVNKYFVIAQLK